MRGVLATLIALAIPANAWAGNDYAVFQVGYRGAAAAASAEADASSLNHAARLGFVVYGGDWFMKLRGTLVSLAAGNGETARFVTDAYGGGEVGVHWPRASGNLAVGLVVDGKRVELPERAIGGRGLDGGVSLHFAFPWLGRLRLDPSIAAGASVLYGDGTYSGVFAYGEIEALVKVSSVLSIWVGAGLDARTYGARSRGDGFSSRTIRFDVGVAFHDLFGIGHNAF